MAILDHPVVLLLAAVLVPFAAVALALLVAKAVGWSSEGRRRAALVVGAIACLYFGLAACAFKTSSSPRAGLVYSGLGVLWAGLAWFNRLGPGSHGGDE